LLLSDWLEVKAMTPAELPVAQGAEIVWQDQDKKHRGWNVHLHVGAEVIKYRLDPDRNADDRELVSLAVKAAADDGYQLKPDTVKVTR
jgi:hypothetical protein